MSFWDNVKDAITRAGTTQEWAAKNAKISFNTFKGWISKGILPRADEAVRIASALNCTVEELVNGIKGREYILSWAGAHGAQWKPPPRIKDLVDVAVELPDNKVKELVAIAEVFAQSEKAETGPRSDAI